MKHTVTIKYISTRFVSLPIFHEWFLFLRLNNSINNNVKGNPMFYQVILYK